MAKVNKPSPSAKPKAASKSFIPEQYQDVFYMAVLFISVFIFLGGAIFGNGFNATDTIASLSFKPYIEDASHSGHFPLWVPYIFCGMPSYASLLVTGDRWWDIVPKIVFGATNMIGKLMGNDIARVACFYGIYSIGMYLLMRSKKLNRFASFFGAFAAAYSTYVITWVMIGHNTKPVVLSLLPFAFLFTEKLREKFSLIYTLGLIVIIHLMLEASHLQMIFYSICAVGLYLVFELVSRLISKNNPMSVVKVAGILVVAGGISFLLSSDRYLAVQEYTSYSTRGSAPISKDSKTKVDDNGGNTYQYATAWSFSPPEMMVFLVPNFFGYGTLKYDINKPEHSGSYLSQALANSKSGKLNTYWGQKESEDSPPYMGIAILFLGILGLILNRKNIFVQFLFALSIFSVVLSFGHNFPLLYDIFFNMVPSFNKFRAPSMSLVLIQFAMPILAGFGLSSIIEMAKQEIDESKIKIIRNFVIVSAAFIVLGFLFSAMFKDSYMSSMNGSRIAKMYQQELWPEIKSFVWSEMISDWYVTGLILLATFGLVFLYVRRQINEMILFPALALLLVVDMWRVDARPMEEAEQKLDQVFFQKTDVIDFLQRDNSKFRIADLGYFQSPNVAAYFKIQSVNGYQPAKMRIYQDLLDVTSDGSTGQLLDPSFWNLMNVKYILHNKQIGGYRPVFQSQDGATIVYENDKMYQRAFFVDKVEIAKGIDIINKIKFDPNKNGGMFDAKKLAYMEKKPEQTIDVPDSTAKATLIGYEDEKITIKAKASGNNLLFLSEIYLPIGWKAYIDDKETPIYKTDYAFRSVIVPKGEHTVEFKFTSDKFEMGKKASMGLNVLLVLGFIAGYYIEKKKKGATEVEEEETV